jgi:glycerol uptake facilitator protein
MSSLSVRVARPQAVRVGGLTEVLEKLPPSDRKATCTFDLDKDVEQPPVPCLVDPVAGTVDCDVPAGEGSPFSSEVMQFRLSIGDDRTELLSVRYADVSLHVAADLASSETSGGDSFQRRMLSKITGGKQRQVPLVHDYTLAYRCLAEAVGTMLMVVIGTGSVCSSVLTGFNNGDLWPVASVWGVGVALAIAATASVSAAHLNPAVSLAFALFRPDDFSWSHLLPYWGAQFLGAALAGAFNLMLFGRQFRHYEAVKNIVRGSPESVLTASAFGEYFPNPGYTDKIAASVVTPALAMLVELWATGILMFVIVALTDRRQTTVRSQDLVPVYVGATVAILIALYAPLTQMCLNPARDFGPRVIAALAGWGRVAIPGPRNGFWVYIVGPMLGAPLGALVYDLAISAGLA